ncbi:DoxX family membrane protein [Dactylosporangium sucinum]|uniref:Membrane protein n=1 Tax=Dactylosporangium sucinum TaxID=1424081 RepID=A0A917TWS7_9ACTN|nr:DoxX family membrane protein [Dactylosporangium sucinum]GGM41122.1 membrane protein [Dactylosporangium sucinum]
MTTVNHSPANHLERVEAPGSMLTRTAAKALAVLRFATGSVFLWAFADKAFGLGYSTPSAKAWVNGGSPTNGFLKSVDVGPFQSAAHAAAGTWWANWLFMLGLLGIGLALVSGIGLRVAAVSGTLMMAAMWLAEFPIAQHTASGAPSGSSNPLVDYHVVYAVALIVLALSYAGHTWGLGRRWAKLPFVQRNRWLI